jgi:hypothetical protein
MNILQLPLYIFLLLLGSCSLTGRNVTMQEFYQIDVSTTSAQVIAILGEPYAIHQKRDGVEEYEYIERITIGARYAEERHYFIAIKNGKVVSKRVDQASPLPLSFDSYDMQTTQSDS